MQNDPKGNKSKGNAKNGPRNKCVQFIAKLEWNFWADSGWAVLGMVIATFLATPVFDSVGDTMKIYLWVTGFCFAIWVAAMFVAHSVVLIREGRTTAQREAEQEQDKLKLQNKIDHLESDLAGANERIKEFDPRFISEDQWQKITVVISMFPNQIASIQCQQGDIEAKRYAQQFVFLLQDAKWKIDSFNESGNFGRYDNAIVCMSEKDRDNNSLPPAGTALAIVLAEVGITAQPNVVWFDNIPSGEVRLLIGIKRVRQSKILLSPKIVVSTQATTIHISNMPGSATEPTSNPAP